MSTLEGFSVTPSLSYRVGHRPPPTRHHVEGGSGLRPLSEIGEGEAAARGEVDEHLGGLLGHAKPLVSCWPPTSPRPASRRRRRGPAPPLPLRERGRGPARGEGDEDLRGLLCHARPFVSRRP